MLFRSANGTFAFTYGPTIVEVATGRTVYSNQPAGLNGSELYWDALDPDKYYFFSGASLMRRNLSAQTNTTMKTFPATLQSNGGSVNIQSGNGRYFTVRYGGTNQVWDSLWAPECPEIGAIRLSHSLQSETRERSRKQEIGISAPRTSRPDDENQQTTSMRCDVGWQK